MRCRETILVNIPDTPGLIHESLVLQCTKELDENNQHPGMCSTGEVTVRWTPEEGFNHEDQATR